MMHRLSVCGAVVALCVVVSGCSGIRKTNDTFAVHAESVRILGYAIPEDDQAAAARLVPPGGKVETVEATPADWSSLIGAIGNILWIHQTRIDGTMPTHSGK